MLPLGSRGARIGQARQDILDALLSFVVSTCGRYLDIGSIRSRKIPVRCVVIGRRLRDPAVAACGSNCSLTGRPGGLFRLRSTGAVFDDGYLALFNDVVKALHPGTYLGGGIHLARSGEHTSIIVRVLHEEVRDKFFGLVMPMRGEDLKSKVPAFARHTQKEGLA